VLVAADTTGTLLAWCSNKNLKTLKMYCVGDIVKIWIGPAGTKVPEEEDEFD
jgi:hypothetical protein